MAAMRFGSLSLAVIFAVIVCQASGQLSARFGLGGEADPLEVAPASRWWIGESLPADDLKNRPAELLHGQPGYEAVQAVLRSALHPAAAAFRRLAKTPKLHDLYRVYLL